MQPLFNAEGPHGLDVFLIEEAYDLGYAFHQVFSEYVKLNYLTCDRCFDVLGFF